MEANPQVKSDFVIEFPCIDQMMLVFPEDRVQEALDAFHILLRNKTLVGQQNSPEQELARLLKLLGWNCTRQNNGSFVLTEYAEQNLDLEHDPVLVHAVGIVEPGSFVLGHAAHEFGPSWWISYTAQEKQVHQGLPTKDQIEGLMVCPECGSLNPRDWHHIQYTAIRYPAQSVNPLHIVTTSNGEVLYECVLKEYLECRCGADLARNGREIV
jgi:hypothetical protein